MYKPKVGDVLVRKSDGWKFTILQHVNDIVIYTVENSYSVNIWRDFSKTFKPEAWDFPKEKFVPMLSEGYYFVQGNGVVYEATYYSNDIDNKRFQIGNMFKSRIEADEALVRIKLALNS